MKKFFILLAMMMFLSVVYSAGKVDKVTGQWREQDFSGAYNDLSGKPTLATVATSGSYADLAGKPTLGTASALDVGTTANKVVQLDSSAKLPAVDGSQLTNVSSGLPATTIINQLHQALAENSENANISANQAYSATLPSGTSKCKVLVRNVVNPLAGKMDFNYTRLTLHLNNNVTDSSSVNATVTNTDVTFTNEAGEYKFGYAAVFNGTSAKLTAPHIAGFNLGASTNPWTIECWYKPTTGGSGDRNILAHYKTAASYDGWVLYHSSAGKVGFGCYNPSLSAVSTTTLSDGTWYHIAIVNNGTTTKMYINGTEEDSETSINIAPWTTELSIGDNAQGGWLKGTIDEVKIDNGIARYTANFTPPASEFYASWLTLTPASGKQIKKWTTAADKSIILSELGQTVELDRDSNGDWWPRLLIGSTPTEQAD